MLDDSLLEVHKPGQYIGREWNVSVKDFNAAAVRVALCFPDLYEVGMSNLGIRILYGLLNSLPEVACERFFAPDTDMESLLRAKGREFASLESATPLDKFDIVGFSLGYELCYSNILAMLELGRIPLQASQRDQRYPLIIAGGPAAANPEPLHEFFDFFFIGEAEEAALEISALYLKLGGQFKQGIISKEELLLEFSAVEGVYVPSLYDVDYAPEGKIREFKPRYKRAPAVVKKRFIRDLNKAFFPVDWLVPYVQIVHDRVTLEIMRGCPNSCRFCQARQQYFPFRQREAENVLALARGCIGKSGYEELSLAGLSVSDYYRIEELMRKLVDMFKQGAVSVSFPSLRPKNMVGEISALSACIKKAGLTFAPEAATERLRKILNKDFSLDDFNSGLSQAFAAGYQRCKLYFMIGLPSETEADLEAILEFADSVSNLRKKISRFPAQVNVSINTLVPKPHTAFQWFGMAGLEEMSAKIEFLKARVRNKRVRLSFHDPRMSFLEAVFSRGDRRLSKVIFCAYRKGARFDAWGNRFNFQLWMDAFQECGIEASSYLKALPPEERLPWDFLDMGVSRETLLSEFNKAVAMQ